MEGAKKKLDLEIEIQSEAGKTGKRIRMAGTVTAMLCAVALNATTAATGQAVGDTPSMNLAAVRALATVGEPPEIQGAPIRTPGPVPSYVAQIANGKAWQAANPDKPGTIAPALHELDGFIKQGPDEPYKSYLYATRATLLCYSHAAAATVVADIDKALALYKRDESNGDSPQMLWALRGRMQLAAGDSANAVNDLERAAQADLHYPQNLFNDGKITSTKESQPCSWSIADLDLLARKYPKDARPLMFKGLYLLQFQEKDKDDHAQTLALYDEASKLAPDSPLPYYLTGRIFLSPSLADKYSLTRASCIEVVVPRTKACQAMDEYRAIGIRDMTAALAIDPKFAPAYAERAEAYRQQTQYRQAIRDYTDALAFETEPRQRAILYSDRGLTRYSTKQYTAAVEDLTQGIRLECSQDNSETCIQYETRAGAYTKLGQIDKAIADVTLGIRSYLKLSMIMGIGTFRRIYPEYDSVRDDIVTDLVRRHFYPGLTYADFAKTFAVKQDGIANSGLAVLYIKRGDLYAMQGKHVQANRDYDRATSGFPDMVKSYFETVNGHRVRVPDDEQ